MKKKQQSKIAIFRRILLVCAAVILGIVIYNFNAQSLMGNQMPIVFNIGVGVVMTGSMEPELNIDDVVIVQKKEQYQVNDIVIFQNADLLVIHRIIQIDGNEIITKGDANNMVDAPIKKEDIKGKLILHIPKMGHVVKFLKQPTVMIVVLVVAVVLAEYSFRKEKEEDDEEIKLLMEEIKRLKEE